jgi:hypothetical protein
MAHCFEPSNEPPTADADQACALILLHVDVMHYATIQHLTSAAEVWDSLERTSRGGVYARKLKLRRELHHSVMGGGESVQVYVARIRLICVDLLAVGVSVADDEVVPALLAGLTAAYEMVVTVIESSEEELTVDTVVTKLLSTEARVARDENAEAHVAALLLGVATAEHQDDGSLLCSSGIGEDVQKSKQQQPTNAAGPLC